MKKKQIIKSVEVQTFDQTAELVKVDQVQTKEQVTHENEMNAKLKFEQNLIREHGVKIIHALGSLSTRYLDLCLDIRKHKLSPALVTRTLLDMGFNKVRVSEINRVAQAGDDLFSKYEARQLGFNKVLDLARKDSVAGVAVQTEGAHLLLDSGVETVEEMTGDIEEQMKEVMMNRPAKKQKSDKQKIALACALIGRLAKKSFTTSIDNVEIEVTVKQVKEPKAT